MALSRDVYRELGEIVGPENISDDPVILESYRHYFPAELMNPEQKRRLPIMPAAVLLPGSTEEVQAIVKTANKHKIKVRAHGTGWILLNAAFTKGTIVLDLNRMNKVLEIDEKNMFAIVEPMTTAGALQAEAMKKGLNCHMIGAGSSCSVIATTWCAWGMSPQGIYTGYGAENGLAVEWVTPEGEIIRTGSLGSGMGWFCGEGPGPSTRGIIRGHFGGIGGWGIVTKAAIKLHPWVGPSEYPIGREIPYRASLPENFRAHSMHWPSEEACADAVDKIWDAGIGLCVHRQFNFFGEALQGAVVLINEGIDPEKNFDNLEKVLEDPEAKELNEELRHSLQIILMGNSDADIEWQERALDQILEETKGRKVARMETPTMEQLTLLFLTKLATKNSNFLYSGTFMTGYAPAGTPDFNFPSIDMGRKSKLENIKRGGIVDDGGDSSMGTMGLIGGGGAAYLEQFFFHTPGDPKSVRLATDATMDEFIGDRAKMLPMYPAMYPFYAGSFSEKELELLGWQWRIKRAFDPNGAGDIGYVNAPPIFASIASSLTKLIYPEILPLVYRSLTALVKMIPFDLYKRLMGLVDPLFSVLSGEIPKLPGHLAGTEPIVKAVLDMIPGLIDRLEKSEISERLTEQMTNIFAAIDPILRPVLRIMALPLLALVRVLENPTVNSFLSRAIDLITRPLVERLTA